MAIYSKVVQFQAGQTLAFDEKEMEIAQVLSENVTLGHLPDHVSFIVSQYLIVVVQDLTIFENQAENHYYMGFESSLSEEEQVDSQETSYQVVLKVSFGSSIYYRMERTPLVSPIVPTQHVTSLVLLVHFSSLGSCYRSPSLWRWYWSSISNRFQKAMKTEIALSS